MTGAAQALDFRTGDTPTPDVIILTHKLTRDYQVGSEVVHALRGVDIQIPPQRVYRDHGPIRFRQIYIDEPSGLPRYTHQRRILAQQSKGEAS